MVALALSAYEDLARIAVFLEQARYDEVNYETKSTTYAPLYKELEEQYILWMLCELKKFIHR